MLLFCLQFSHGRIVYEDDTVKPAAFYNYLTAWVNTDVLAYTSCEAELYPPPKQWFPNRIQVTSKYYVTAIFYMLCIFLIVVFLHVMQFFNYDFFCIHKQLHRHRNVIVH